MKGLIKSAAIIVMFSTMAGAAYAQGSAERDAALSDFSKDLADLQSQIPTTALYQAWLSEQKMGLLENLTEKLIKKASELKDKWGNNPYVSVTGFSLSVGVPPSLDVEFEFK